MNPSLTDLIATGELLSLSWYSLLERTRKAYEALPDIQNFDLSNYQEVESNIREIELTLERITRIIGLMESIDRVSRGKAIDQSKIESMKLAVDLQKDLIDHYRKNHAAQRDAVLKSRKYSNILELLEDILGDERIESAQIRSLAVLFIIVQTEIASAELDDELRERLNKIEDKLNLNVADISKDLAIYFAKKMSIPIIRIDLAK